MFDIAAGIIIAAVVLSVTGLGLSIALDFDNQRIGASAGGWWLTLLGCGAGAIVIYIAA